MNQEVLMALIGIASSIISSATTWIFARRKYNAEVDNTEIQNLKETLEIYKTVIEDNQRMLGEYSKRVEEGFIEIHKLRTAVNELLALSCVDAVCKKRKMVNAEYAKKILKTSNETEVDKKVP